MLTVASHDLWKAQPNSMKARKYNFTDNSVPLTREIVSYILDATIVSDSVEKLVVQIGTVTIPHLAQYIKFVAE